MPVAKKKPTAPFTHGGLKSRILLALSELPDTLVVNAPTGIGLSLDGKRKMAFGKKGLADIIGASCSIAIAVEVKVGKDELSEDQIKFRANWRRCGGVFVEARDIAKCIQEVKDGVWLAHLTLHRQVALHTVPAMPR
jgi:hypothetical protein